MAGVREMVFEDVAERDPDDGEREREEKLLSVLPLGNGIVDDGRGETCGVDGREECFIAERSAMV